MSGLEARVDGMDKYAHEKWHDLNNSLTPLALLPERITRDIAKIHGQFEGRIGTITKDIERSITAAVEKAIEPVNANVADLTKRMAALEAERIARDSTTSLVKTILKSPLIGWFVAAGGVVWGVITGKIHV